MHEVAKELTVTEQQLAVYFEKDREMEEGLAIYMCLAGVTVLFMSGLTAIPLLFWRLPGDFVSQTTAMAAIGGGFMLLGLLIIGIHRRAEGSYRRELVRRYHAVRCQHPPGA